MKPTTFALPLLLLAISTITLAQNASTPKPGPADFPTIVGSLSLTAQSDKVPPTVLFTPATNGLFRLSVDLVISKRRTNSGQFGFWEGDLKWTDVKPESRLGPQVDVRALGSHDQGQTYTFSAVAGQPITFSTMKARVGDSTYDVFVILEQLADLPNF